MFIDSHCHLDFPELAAQLPDILRDMQAHRVSHGLCISVNLEDFPRVLALAKTYPNLFATVGVHPDYEDVTEPSVDQLVAAADDARVVGIGETGLDYFRLTGDLAWQRARFRTHIQAARIAQLPLIVHTRSAAEDTLRLLHEESACDVGGVLHCFTESWEVAEQALDLGFYISISGIVTFKNALTVKAVAQRVPLDRLLIETDSPYLAPVPHRGKMNRPGWVAHVAAEIALLRGVSVECIAEASTANFFRLFSKAHAS